MISHCGHSNNSAYCLYNNGVSSVWKVAALVAEQLAVATPRDARVRRGMVIAQSGLETKVLDVATRALRGT